MELLVNGQMRSFENLSPASNLEELLAGLGLKGDRIAVEYNGTIIPRNDWAKTLLHNGAKLEIVHFVGGGSFTGLHACLPSSMANTHAL